MAGACACARILTTLAVLAACSSACAHGAPPIPDTAGPVTTRELVKMNSLDGLAVSPDGAYAAIRVDRQDAERNLTVLEWRIVRLSDGQTMAVVDGGSPRWNVNGYLAAEGAQWSPDSKTVYFRKLTGEELQLWSIGRDGSGPKELTDSASDIAAFFVDGTGVVHYATGPATREEIKAAEAVEYDTGVLLDDSLITGFPVTHSFPVNGRMATYRLSPTAKAFGRATLLGETPLKVKTIQPDGQASDAVEDVVRRMNDIWDQSMGGEVAIDPVQPGRAMHVPTNRVARVSQALDDPPAKRTYISYGRALSWTGPGAGEVFCRDRVCAEADHLVIVSWSADGSELIFQSQSLGTARLNRWDVGANTVRTVVATPGRLGSSQSGTEGQCQLAGEEAICIAAAADSPPKLVAVHLESGKQRVLVDPNPGLTQDRLGVARQIELTDRWGSTTVGHVVLPRNRDPAARLPLVITSYSCDGFLLGGSGRDVPEHVLAGMGFAAICVDHSGPVVRRAPAFSFMPENSQNSALDFYEDAIRILEGEGVADPERVLLTGFSGSATNAASAITRSRSFTAAAVTTRGSLDAISCYLTSHTRSCEDWARKEGQTPPYDNRAGILSQSPAWHADRIVTPFLMQLPEVEYTGMMQLYGAMLDYGRAVEMHIFADAYHYKHQPRQRLSVYDRNVDWARFWLQGLSSASEGRETQTARWEAMRVKQCRLFEGEGAFADPPWYCRR